MLVAEGPVRKLAGRERSFAEEEAPAEDMPAPTFTLCKLGARKQASFLPVGGQR